MLREDDPRTCYGNHGRRRSTLPHGRWYFDAPAPVVALQDLPDSSCEDLGQELRALVEAVSAAGAPQVVVVDLSPHDLPVSVARVIVPGLETGMVDGAASARRSDRSSRCQRLIRGRSGAQPSSWRCLSLQRPLKAVVYHRYVVLDAEALHSRSDPMQLMISAVGSPQFDCREALRGWRVCSSKAQCRFERVAVAELILGSTLGQAKKRLLASASRPGC